MNTYLRRILIVIACLILIAVLISGCANESNNISNNDYGNHSKDPNYINPEGNTIITRFIPPENYIRVKTKEGSFENFLQTLPLQPPGAKVRQFNGVVKDNDSYVAVLDWDITPKDLEHCADAIMRLRAEYLYAKGEYDKISFHFVSGFNCQYSKWLDGYRVILNGNDAFWEKRAEPDDSYECFRQYLDTVHTYASTISLEQELELVEDWNDISIGDIFIKSGSPGHAIIVVDMAINEETGDKVFLTAQSNMPAQQTHILKNINDPRLSPWYRVDEKDKEIFDTPEWSFEGVKLMRFPKNEEE